MTTVRWPKATNVSLISNVVNKLEDIICDVNAAICSIDLDVEHIECYHPFMNAELSIFIDRRFEYIRKMA